MNNFRIRKNLHKQKIETPVKNNEISETSINNTAYEDENIVFDKNAEFSNQDCLKKMPKFKVLKTIANSASKPEKIRLHQALQHHKFVHYSFDY